MTDKLDGKRWGWGWAIAIGFLVVSSLYGGAYDATIQPVGWGRMGMWHTYMIGGYYLPWGAQRFFAPAHWIDRQLRPDKWADSDATLTVPDAPTT